MLESPDQEGNQEFDEEVLHMRQLLKTKLTDSSLNLSVRDTELFKGSRCRNTWRFSSIQ